MFEKKENARTQISLRDYGYLLALTILGISIGLLLYPSLSYPAIWQWVTAGLSIVLMALTAPALRKRK